MTTTPDHQPAARIRSLCRAGRFDGPTAGVALGYVQVNLVILRAHLARDFDAFCRHNPQPCPLLERTEPGNPEPKRLAPGGDLRRDLPRYRVFKKGVCVDRPTDIDPWWRDDFVAFLIGCSFTFEAAMLAAGLPVRHIEEGCNVPMFRTNLPCKPVGPFTARMIVSMRPMTPEQARQAARVTGAFPKAHGPPIHVGDPKFIGIESIHHPDFGDPVTIKANEVPVFWACGVTPMEAATNARLDIVITHEPGHMLVTDLKDQALRKASGYPGTDFRSFFWTEGR